jgi:hypothetical protein
MIKNTIMKTLFTLSSLVSLVVSGIASLRLFQHAHYDISALLTVTSFLSITLLVMMTGSRKAVLQ